MTFGLVFSPHLQFLYNLTRIILNFNEIYKNHKIQKLKRLKNERCNAILNYEFLNFLNLMLQCLHGQLADVCVAFIILTIFHHRHLPSNHLCIADIFSSICQCLCSLIVSYKIILLE